RTFSQQVFTNTPNAPIDGVTRQKVELGPIPDNQSTPATDGTRDTLFNFGDRQSLLAVEGRVYSAWAGNENQGPLDIIVASVAIPDGPRVVESTMGPIRRTTNNNEFSATCLEAVILPNTPCAAVGQVVPFNNTINAANGVRQLNGFTITFDRFVDPRSFYMPQDPSVLNPDAVRVFFRAPTAPVGAVGTPIAEQFVVPVFDDRVAGEDPKFGNLTAQRTWCNPVAGVPCGAKKFLVLFAPQSATGTYSYSVGPAIRDRIRGAGFVVQGGTTMSFAAQ